MKFLEAKVYGIILRTYAYLEKTGRENSFARFPYLHVLTGRLAEEGTAKQNGKDEPETRYYKLLRRLDQMAEKNGECRSDCAHHMDRVLYTAVDLCLAVMQVPEFAAYLNYYTGNTVTLQLAFEMEGIFYPDYNEVLHRLRLLQRICRIDWKKQPLPFATIEGDNRLYAYFTGADLPERTCVDNAEWFLHKEYLHPLFIRQKLAEKAAEIIENGGLLQIAGNGGGRFLAKHAARLLGRDLLLVNVKRWGERFLDESEHILSELVREAFFGEGIVCFYGIDKEFLHEFGTGGKEFWQAVLRPFGEAGIPLIFCTEYRICLPGSVPRVAYENTTRKEREALLSGFCGLYGFSLDCPLYSVRYRLSASETAKAMERWRYAANSGREPEEMRFSRICYEIVCGSKEKALGEVLFPKIGFSDLKLPAEMIRTLKHICCSASKGYRIYEDWNLKGQYPYGRAVSALLAGPPGTGKTMTAHVIAGELGIPLYQVDLSHIMDKYIGETEKHLEQAFSFAEKTNMVLFFDEADALFGKRGEVAEGKDRYANMEVAYLLQRIEQFEGVVVLATNFYQNIDRAFLRRMKYVLKYEAPDQAIRRSIWESCLPPQLPQEGLDLNYLSGQFDLTGGMIKNVVLNACVQALYEEADLTMRHILSAVSAEYEKMERTATPSEWGEYGYLLEEETPGRESCV